MDNNKSNLRLTFDQHAMQARTSVRAMGLADCIHYAPNWQTRVDALYAELNAIDGEWPVDGPALMADGRMVVIGHTVAIIEMKEG